ncbi:DUF6350 family protein [Brevibacterium otitidis]|uniref:DUF6350 family protein n=1 Tax=Brevibacterium otitidis TaxID=53364 RepID=A0ABV5WYK8_9MICO|nr:hypothetical protein GCM10023233_19040 [Brevibacterium otitidis]
MNPAAESPTSRPRHLGRHPAVIGVLEIVRVLLMLLTIAFLLSAIAWFIGIAEQQPLAAIPSWAFTGLAAATGLSVQPGEAVMSFPPSLLCLIVWLLLRSAASRTSTALAANARLQEAGQLETHRAPQLSAYLSIAAVFLAVTVGLGFLLGSVAVSVLGYARVGLLTASAIVLGARLHPTQAAESEQLAARLGAQWTAALPAAHRVRVRTGWALTGLAVIVVAVGLVTEFDEVSAVVELYSAPVAAAIGLSVVQLLYLPGILAIALAWLSGAGVALSATETASVLSPAAGPRPAVPLLAMIPEDPPGFLAAAPALLVILGLLLVTLRRRWQHLDVPAVALATVEVLIFVTVWGLFSTGALGPGGLEVFGVDALRFPLITGGLVCAGLWAGYGIILAARSAQAATASGAEAGEDED